MILRLKCWLILMGGVSVASTFGSLGNCCESRRHYNHHKLDPTHERATVRHYPYKAAVVFTTGIRQRKSSPP